MALTGVNTVYNDIDLIRIVLNKVLRLLNIQDPLCASLYM